MRSSTQILLLSGLAGVAGIACEDGPTQIYQPSPTGAGDNWNDGKVPGQPGNATQSYTGVLGGSTKTERCTAPVKMMRWADMVKEPIIPPRYGAGLDLAGSDDWHGLTIDEAEATNCQSTIYGDAFGDGTEVNYWGDNGEVWADYRVSNRKIIFMTFWPGYSGGLEFKSPDGQHTYKLSISTQITKDGKPFTLDWTGNKGANFTVQGDELFRALMATYLPALPQQPANVTCQSTGQCIKGSFGDVAYFYIPALGWALWIDNQNAAQPVPSIPTRLDQNLSKIMAYAYASPLLKLDKEGPIGEAGNLGNSKVPCTLKMGISYADFLSQCVKVTGDATKDNTEQNKLLGGLSHGDERFHFDVSGIDINFTDNTLKPDDIIHDKDLPHPGDTGTTFLVDQSTLGKFVNDRVGNNPNGDRDNHGAGAVYKEFLRLSRQILLAEDGITDGDQSKCLWPLDKNGIPQAPADQAAFIASLPAWCTGLEGGITVAAPSGKGDFTNVGWPFANKDITSQYGLGMKLGHQKIAYCWDPNGDPATGYANCTAGDVIPNSFAQVLAIYGKGSVANLPSEVQDVRFFWKQYFTALVKYMTVAAQVPTPDLSKITLNPDELFFDSIGAGQFEIAEYVDRRFVTPTQNPTDITFVADVRNGIMDEYEFSRDLFRGEEAVYTAILENQSDGVGAETNGLLTNIFGSPVLKSGWTASSKGKSAYYCATTLDKANCDGQTPPLDANGNVVLDEIGRPLLKPYPGAFGSTAFTLGATPIKVLQTYDGIQSAMVRIPLHLNPYDPKSNPLAPKQFLVPWLPKQPGEGFPVALSGQLDKFIQTAQLDFSGTTITANIDYDAALDPNTHQPMKDGSLQFLAVETTDFLGQVFLCQDPTTGDVLSARMYSPVSKILEWLQNHPGSYDNCQMIIRYSPYNNFPDYINSLSAGVRLGITQGGGFGRVVDVTLFVPGQ